MRFIHSLTNFSSGELSENLRGRVDVDEVKSGLSNTGNALLNPQGGVLKRIGTKMLMPVGPAATDVFCLSFQLENGNSVLLEWSDLYGFRILDKDMNVLFTNAGSFPAVTDRSQFNGTAFGNFLYITHYSGLVAPRAIDCTNYPTIVVYNNIFVGRAPFMDANTDTTKRMRITNADTQGPYTIQSDFNIFTSNHVGHMIMVTGLANSETRYIRKTTAVFIITSYTSATQVTGISMYRYSWGNPLANIKWDTVNDVVVADGANSNWFSEWRFSPFGNAYGWPRVCSSIDGRLVWGSTKTKQNTFWASRINAPLFMQDVRYDVTVSHQFQKGKDILTLTQDFPYNSGDDIQVTDPYQFTLASGDGAPITFIKQSRFSVIGTASAQYLADGDGQVISQLNVGIRQFSTKSSAQLLAVSVDNTVFYTDATRTKVYMYLYNDSNGSYIAKDVTLLYDKFTEANKITGMVYSREFGAVMITTTSGEVVALSYNQESRTLGFTKFFTVDSESSQAMKIICYANMTGSSYRDVGVALVKIGSSFAYVTFKRNDYLTTLPVELFNYINDFEYLDKFSLLTGVNTNTLTGMSLYSDETLVVYGVNNLGAVEITEIEADGSASYTLPNTYTDIAFGVKYAFTMATMPIEAGQAYMTAQLGQKRIDQALIRTSGCQIIKVGTDGYNYDSVPVNENKAVFEMSGSPETDHIVHVLHDSAGPCMINNMTLRGVNNDA